MLPLEMWAGVECTVNRVQDRWRDQLIASGHDARADDDLSRFAALGLRRLRYPALWERTAPEAPDRFDWRWLDARVARLQQLGIEPILGLLHHGSGPHYTSLLDARFPEAFATYAAAVASRFPWIAHYTPINEPLTTARFSALYGHWYPHRCDDNSFARALVNQVRATILSMQAIRRVNSTAQLIQTDDLGRTTSTPRLRYQADFDNERRWLGWDLLCGRVDRRHPMWGYLRSSGIAAAELDWIGEHPCPPDIIGINHYVTSDRHLDDDLSNHFLERPGGNGRDSYVDVAAVRASDVQPAGIAGALDDAWCRYGSPLAITEAHIGCTREEQLRWLHGIWRGAHAARARGIDVRAVTAWALLGSFDWDSLVTQSRRHYEPGAFDVRGPTPRPTALAHLISDLIANRPPRHAALLAAPGWWERARAGHSCSPPLMVTDAAGALGPAFARVCEVRGLRMRACTQADLDTADGASVERMLDETAPWAVVSTSAEVRGESVIARACAVRGLPWLTFSSGRGVMQAHPGALIIHTHCVTDVVNAALDLLIDGERGLWHPGPRRDCLHPRRHSFEL